MRNDNAIIFRKGNYVEATQGKCYGLLGIGVDGVDNKLNIRDFDLKQDSLRHQWSGKR